MWVAVFTCTNKLDSLTNPTGLGENKTDEKTGRGHALLKYWAHERRKNAPDRATRELSTGARGDVKHRVTLALRNTRSRIRADDTSNERATKRLHVKSCSPSGPLYLPGSHQHRSACGQSVASEIRQPFTHQYLRRAWSGDSEERAGMCLSGGACRGYHGRRAQNGAGILPACAEGVVCLMESWAGTHLPWSPFQLGDRVLRSLNRCR